MTALSSLRVQSILILEELEHAKARGANILAEVAGYACTGDAHHETLTDPEGTAGAACMRLPCKTRALHLSKWVTSMRMAPQHHSMTKQRLTFSNLSLVNMPTNLLLVAPKA